MTLGKYERQLGNRGEIYVSNPTNKEPVRKGSSNKFSSIMRWASLAVGMAMASCGASDQPLEKGGVEQMAPQKLSQHLTRMMYDNANGAFNVSGYLEDVKEGQRLFTVIDVVVEMRDGTKIPVRKRVDMESMKAGENGSAVNIEVFKGKVKKVVGELGNGQKINFSF